MTNPKREKRFKPRPAEGELTQGELISRDGLPLEAHCPCPACRHSRGYLRHLFQAGEMLGPILASIHNLTYYQRLLAEARTAIEADAFAEFRAAKLRAWGVVDQPA